MNKQEFLSYLELNPTFFKREDTIRKLSPNIVIEIYDFSNEHHLNPMGFRDALTYYVKDITTEAFCPCGKKIPSYNIFCCKQCTKDYNYLIQEKFEKMSYEKY